MATATLKISDDLKTRISHLAEANHRSAHGLMVQAVTEYVERAEKRASFIREAKEAWEHCQATGLHLTQAEAEAWMRRLEAGEDLEPPECHP